MLPVANQKQIEIAYLALYGTVDIPAPPLPPGVTMGINQNAAITARIRRAGGGIILDLADDAIQYVYDVSGADKALLTLYRRNPNIKRITPIQFPGY